MPNQNVEFVPGTIEGRTLVISDIVRVFKRYAGMSPIRFRKHIRAQSNEALAEAQKKWEVAIGLCRRLTVELPSLRPRLEKRIAELEKLAAGGQPAPSAPAEAGK